MPRKDTNGNEYIEVTYQGELYHVPVDYIMNEHPGGPAEIMDYEDKDMTEAFIDQGHSIDAEMELHQWLAKKGTLHGDDVLDTSTLGSGQNDAARKAETAVWRRQNTLMAVAGGVAAAAAAVAVIVVVRKARS